jgi:hypothetical protein
MVLVGGWSLTGSPSLLSPGVKTTLPGLGARVLSYRQWGDGDENG